MTNTLVGLIVPVVVVTVALLIRAEERAPRDTRQVWLWKPLSTLLVIVVGALSLRLTPEEHDSTYTRLILIGLMLSLAGDMLLIPHENKRAFVAGLVAFLLAHAAYIAAFVYVQASRNFAFDLLSEIVDIGALTLIAVAVYRYLSPGLGSMRVPVIAYMLVISVMVQRALAIAFVHPGPIVQPLMIALGALLFYVSDAILAVNRFRYHDELPHGRRWNLAAYYAGQLLLALSASFFAL